MELIKCRASHQFYSNNAEFKDIYINVDKILYIEVKQPKPTERPKYFIRIEYSPNSWSLWEITEESFNKIIDRYNKNAESKRLLENK